MDGQDLLLAERTVDHMAPESAEPEETGPNRRCLVTGAVLPVERLVRFVIGPDGAVVPDIEAKLPGRGMWLSADRDVINKALAKQVFAKAARRSARAPDDLADRVEALLLKRCIELLGMARRAAQVLAGFEQVRAGLAEGGGLFIEASDAGSDGHGKLQARAANVPATAVLTGAEMGSAFGRDRFVHVLVAPGRLAERLRIETNRLQGLRLGKTN